jgi:hypothetical protein
VRVIDRIELEMEDMIVCRLSSEKEKSEGKFVSEMIRSKNPYLTKDKYLEMKYLIEREKVYLKLITELNGKVTTYLVSIFSKEEPQIGRALKEALLNYAHAYTDCYDNHNPILTLKTEALEASRCDQQVREELVEVLLTMVPVELYNIQERRKEIRNDTSSSRLEAILTDFSDSLQNTIFLSTIELNHDFILFRSEATWKTTNSILNKEHNSLHDSQVDSKLESKQALGHSRPSLSPPETPLAGRNVRLVVVLTSNYHLHLEHEDKIATLRLGEIKLSRRGR